jgi:hypothetical protein
VCCASGHSHASSMHPRGEPQPGPVSSQGLLVRAAWLSATATGDPVRAAAIFRTTLVQATADSLPTPSVPAAAIVRLHVWAALSRPLPTFSAQQTASSAPSAHPCHISYRPTQSRMHSRTYSLRPSCAQQPLTLAWPGGGKDALMLTQPAPVLITALSTPFASLPPRPPPPPTGMTLR